MCRILAVSPSGYYAWVARPESRRAAENRRLVAEIQIIHAASRKTYGSPRVHGTFQTQGQQIGEHRGARLMHANAIRAKTISTWRATTDSAHRHPVVPNTLNRPFAVTVPNRVWAGDITYVWTTEGWLYLAVVLDLYSGHCLGNGEPPDSGIGHGGTHHGRGTPTTRARRGASYGPRVSVGRDHLPRIACRARPDGEQESARDLLGQCRGGTLLPYGENGARASSALADP